MKKTHEQFVEELKRINDNIKVIGTYNKSGLRVECECSVCGHIWSPVARSLLSGHGCPNCYRTRRANQDRKPFEQFLDELSNVTDTITISLKNEYKNTDSKVNCVCKVCGYEWISSPHRLLRGDGCKRCRGILRKTTEQFKDELAEVNAEILVLGEYMNNRTKVECKCKKCGYIWKAKPKDLKNKHSGCPACMESKGEKRIAEYLTGHNVEFERYVKFDGLVGTRNGLLSYDFYIPKYNLLIEYQGNFHDGNVTGKFVEGYDYERQVEHDSRKQDYANQKGYDLLEIWYQDYDNIEKILSEKLK